MNKQIREECGIIGIMSREAPRKALTALKALQHRGQEGWGIATENAALKKVGFVPDLADLSSLKNQKVAIGHNRYSTTGSSIAKNLQPIVKDGAALAHNGNIMQNSKLRELCIRQGAKFESQTDSETLLHLILLSSGNFVNKLSKGLTQVYGAYSIVTINQGKLYAIRDPWGIRPLEIGQLEDGWAVASETIALNRIHAKHIREVKPNEIVEFTPNSMKSYNLRGKPDPHFCVFEYIYLSHHMSNLNNKLVINARISMGKVLAQEDTAPQGQVVSFVPQTSIAAAKGFAAETKLPLVEAITKIKDIRTFIQPTQRERLQSLQSKYKINGSIVAGKDISLVDDSLVRGNTAKTVTSKLKAAGVNRIHIKIASPPITNCCFYGIDIPNKEELLAAKMSEREMCEFLGADSISYLSIGGMIRAIGDNRICNACMSGSYPIPLDSDNTQA